MGETPQYPGKIKQIHNFLLGRNQILSAQSEYKTRPLQSGILHGLQTLIPEEDRQSGILTNPQARKMVDNLLSYQVRLNDSLDFTYAHRPDAAEITAYANQKEREARINLDISIKELHSPELETVISNSISEVKLVEAFIASKKGKLSFGDIEKYRNVVNAISICAVTRAILGPKYMEKRLPTLSFDNMNWEGIQSKYSWVFSSDPQNNVERTVLIMHNLSMAGQIDDDWYGRHVDSALGIESFATAALEENAGNQSQAQTFLEGIKYAYLTKAKRLGLNPIGVLLIDRVHKKLQKTLSWTTRQARYSENPRLKKLLHKKVVGKLGLREIAFAQGKI